ncbi:MAG: type II toxin-antitoxin system prevent-host-death family antitoxin [Gemmatimonadaceae bacterium]|nr:type II toxin-antitoxin system prevent-host-death family antitoxin [Gemmatimonadaceae bacterium]
MKTVNIHAAKTQLSRLIADAVGGEEVVISKAGTPLVRLVPVSVSHHPRPLGALAGLVVESDDCWADDPELSELFYGSDAEPK